MKTTRFLIAAALLAAAPGLRAQDASPDTAQKPACAEGGISRIAMSVPPGQSREEAVAALQASGTLPEGTQVKILARGERPQVVNGERFASRMQMHMQRLFEAGLQVNGAAVTLVELNADGEVTAVHPATGNREVDRSMRDLWRQARFEPTVVGGCRVPVWLHVTLDFESEYGQWNRDMRVRPNP
jgi:aromatic ring-cleaving dioxygenase